MIDWTSELEDEICGGIATSDRGLEHLCAENKWPHPASIYRHLIDSSSFCEKYTRARKNQAQLLADQIIAIADTTEPGEVVTLKPDGEERKIADMIDHRRLRIESRKWLAMKLLPKIYGEKLAHTGADGEGPAEVIVRHIGQSEH